MEKERFLSYYWPNRSSQINTRKQGLLSIQLHVLVERERFSQSKSRQTVPFISFCIRRAREKGDNTSQSAPLLVGQTTRVGACEHTYCLCNLRILLFPETPHIPRAILPAMAGGGVLGSFICIVNQSLKLFPIYLPKLYSFLLGSRISSLSVLSSRGGKLHSFDGECALFVNFLLLF